MKIRYVYLAGPMRGYDDFNYPAFHAGAAQLRSEGLGVFNPAENFMGDQSLSIETYLRQAAYQVLASDGVMVLPGWEKSAGARYEVLLAQTIGLPVMTMDRVPIECAAEVYLCKSESTDPILEGANNV